MTKFSCSLLTVLAVLLALCDTHALGSEFEMAGTMTASPEGQKAFSCSMQIYVRDCQWAIFQVWQDSTNRSVTEVSDDGENVYLLNRFETNSRPFLPEDWSTAAPNGWSGQVHPAHFPFKILNTEVISLFYGYASSCYLDQHTNQVINLIPFQHGDESRSPAGAFAFITRSAPPLRLPGRIVFRNEFQYDTNAILESTSFTNIANLQIPLKVSLVRYLPHTTNILETFVFQANRVTEKCSLKSFKPALPGRALVTDYRNGSQASPQMTDGWPVARTE